MPDPSPLVTENEANALPKLSEWLSKEGWTAGMAAPQTEIVKGNMKLPAKASLLSFTCFEQPDGTPYRIDIDYFGKKRNEGNPFPGPFAGAAAESSSGRTWSDTADGFASVNASANCSSSLSSRLARRLQFGHSCVCRSFMVREHTHSRPMDQYQLTRVIG